MAACGALTGSSTGRQFLGARHLSSASRPPWIHSPGSQFRQKLVIRWWAVTAEIYLPERGRAAPGRVRTANGSRGLDVERVGRTPREARRDDLDLVLPF